MKLELSSLDIYYLVREFAVLAGAKIDRIYESADRREEFLFVFHKTGEGKKFLKVVLPSLIFLDEEKDSYENPTGLCMMLRKYLEGSRLTAISQKDFERIMVLEFESRAESTAGTFFVIIELFSKGNLIFCDSTYKILNLYEDQHWSDRVLKKNETYKFPQSSANPLQLTQEQFAKLLANSAKESLVKSLAIECSLGGAYAEILCTSAGLDKNCKTTALDAQKLQTLYHSFSALFTQEPQAVKSNNRLFPLALKSFAPAETYPSFSNAIAVNYPKFSDDTAAKSNAQNIARIESIIAEQEKKLAQYEEEFRENQRKAELIYEKYQEVSAILETIKSARKKYSWKEIREKIVSDPQFRNIITDIDEKEHAIVIDIARL